MPDHFTNAYTTPEEYGLEIVAHHDVYEADWDFDMVVVWRDAAGDLWAAHDSGCSCPCPFEGHVFPTDFTPVRVERDVTGLYPPPGPTSDYRRAEPDGEFRRKVREALEAVA